MGSFELFINLAVIGLLVPTIIYACRLNKNLNVLRQNQNSLAKLVESLNEATFKAEKSIPKLKSFTEHTEEDLKEAVEYAKSLKDDLIFINDRANGLANRLEEVISCGRGLQNKTPEQKTDDKGEKIESSDDDRAAAELELLKALRSIK